jgi:hypothetical protein
MAVPTSSQIKRKDGTLAELPSRITLKDFEAIGEVTKRRSGEKTATIIMFRKPFPIDG